MRTENHTDIAVVGAGIVGLAVAYEAAKEGYSVAVFERSGRSLGASVRNFGLIWPIGQPAGPAYERALRSRAVWLELGREAGVWVNENGSLHLAYRPEEAAVLEEFQASANENGYQCDLIDAREVANTSNAAKTDGLLTALKSRTEATVSPRQALPAIAAFLTEKYGVEFHWAKCITHVEQTYLSSFYDYWRADRIFICNGADFETLYPRQFARAGLLKCKLQMMRTAAQPAQWNLGPSLCSGLTMRHYAAFQSCKSLSALNDYFEREMPRYGAYGIHVLLSQNHAGELLIGDSHEYGMDIDPFDNEEINKLILDYLRSFANFPDWNIAEGWHGIYPKMQNGSELLLEADPGVWIINGLGGTGMTMAFGLAQEVLKKV